MQQATRLDGPRFDLLSLSEDGVCSAEVDVGRCQVAEALVVAVVVVVLDEAGDGLLERTRKVVILEQDPVLQGLVPALDLALGLGMVRSAADMIHALLLEPGGKIVGDIGRAIVAEQPRPMGNRCAVAS